MRVQMSATYLGRTDMTSTSIVKAEETIFISDQGNTEGKLLDGTKCEILIDTRASLSYMSKMYYLRCKSLQNLHQNHKEFELEMGNTLGCCTLY